MGGWNVLCVSPPANVTSGHCHTSAKHVLTPPPGPACTAGPVPPDPVPYHGPRATPGMQAPWPLPVTRKGAEPGCPRYLQTGRATCFRCSLEGAKSEGWEGQRRESPALERLGDKPSAAIQQHPLQKT